jgi:hypothetical protein
MSAIGILRHSLMSAARSAYGGTSRLDMLAASSSLRDPKRIRKSILESDQVTSVVGTKPMFCRADGGGLHPEGLTDDSSETTYKLC